MSTQSSWQGRRRLLQIKFPWFRKLCQRIQPHPSVGPVSPELQSAINAIHSAIVTPHPDDPRNVAKEASQSD